MTAGGEALVEALKRALEADPGNGPLWLHLADLLEQADRGAEAIAALKKAVELGGDEQPVVARLVSLLRKGGHLAEALIRAEQALEGGDDPRLRLELARVLLARGDREGALTHYAAARGADARAVDDALEALAAGVAPAGRAAPGAAAATAAPRDARLSEPIAVGGGSTRQHEAPDPDDREEARITFADVAGLEHVKNQIRLRIIAPFRSPEIYRAYRRAAGGGILLYGPPGCGKTFIARATAGECGASFLPVGIHEILDKYWGESERIVHAVFEKARDHAPTVVFFDEFDALGSNRGRSESQFWKTLVNQLLQEMDGIGGRTQDVLVFAATNAPWGVDAAFRRPGRFDRVLLVPPPDATARREILGRRLARLPGGEQIALDRLVERTALMTGADLEALCERAAETALARSLETGNVHPVGIADFERELKTMGSSAAEWLAAARNYARYANEGGQYDELVEYLKSVKRW